MSSTKTQAEMEAFTATSIQSTDEAGVVTWLPVHEPRGVWYPRFNHERTVLQFYELDQTPDVGR